MTEQLQKFLKHIATKYRIKDSDLEKDAHSFNMFEDSTDKKPNLIKKKKDKEDAHEEVVKAEKRLNDVLEKFKELSVQEDVLPPNRIVITSSKPLLKDIRPLSIDKTESVEIATKSTSSSIKSSCSIKSSKSPSSLSVSSIPAKRKSSIKSSVPSTTSSHYDRLKTIEATFDEKTIERELATLEYTDLLRIAHEKYPKVSVFLSKNGLRGVRIHSKYKLEKYQVDTIKWMRQREATSHHGMRGGLLALEMGLGKSIISVLLALTQPKGKFPTLIVASKMIMREWKTECIEKWFHKNSVNVLYLHKDFINVDNLNRENIEKYDIVFTTYDTCLSATRANTVFIDQVKELGDAHSLHHGKVVAVHCRTANQANMPGEVGKNVLYGTPWERVICDESTRFANPSTKTYIALMALYGKYKWCLSGTPVVNYDTDIWAQMRFCGYTGCIKKTDWKRRSRMFMVEHSLNQVIAVKKRTDVGVPQLPPKIYHKISITLTGKNKVMYDRVLERTLAIYSAMMKKLVSFSCVLAMFTRLRQCVIAPYLLTKKSKRTAKESPEAEKEIQQATSTDEVGKWCHDIDGEAGIYSPRLVKIREIIASIPDNEKIVIFSTFVACLDLIAYSLKKLMPTVLYLQIDGDLDGNERADILKSYRGTHEYKVLLISYKVGGQGINLPEATHCLCVEPWWNNAVHLQAEARLWRPPQSKNVHVYNIYVSDSIESKIVQICNEKKQLSDHYLEGAKGGKMGTGLGKAGMAHILGYYGI